jgi:hypothetical protein
MNVHAAFVQVTAAFSASYYAATLLLIAWSMYETFGADGRAFGSWLRHSCANSSSCGGHN